VKHRLTHRRWDCRIHPPQQKSFRFHSNRGGVTIFWSALREFDEWNDPIWRVCWAVFDSPWRLFSERSGLNGHLCHLTIDFWEIGTTFWLLISSLSQNFFGDRGEAPFPENIPEQTVSVERKQFYIPNCMWVTSLRISTRKCEYRLNIWWNMLSIKSVPWMTFRICSVKWLMWIEG
jgi:hypothetical protein